MTVVSLVGLISFLLLPLAEKIEAGRDDGKYTTKIVIVGIIVFIGLVAGVSGRGIQCMIAACIGAILGLIYTESSYSISLKRNGKDIKRRVREAIPVISITIAKGNRGGSD